MSSLKKKFGNKLKKCRVSAGVTQAVLAEKVGVTDRAVADWESGNSSPRFSNLEMIAETLNIEVKVLFDF